MITTYTSPKIVITYESLRAISQELIKNTVPPKDGMYLVQIQNPVRCICCGGPAHATEDH